MHGNTNHDLTQEKVSGCLILQVWPLRIHRVPKAAMWSSLSGGETNLLLLYDQGFGEIQLFPQVRDASWGNAGSDWIEQYIGFLAEGQGILCLFFLHHKIFFLTHLTNLPQVIQMVRDSPGDNLWRLNLGWVRAEELDEAPR